MQLYRQAVRRVDPRQLLAQVRSNLARLLRAGPIAHAAVIELLLAFGECETAIADALAPELDDETELTRMLRAAAVELGRAVHHSWSGPATDTRAALERLQTALGAVPRRALPTAGAVGLPEGYVQYGLYPETYQRAAELLRADIGAAPVIVIGLRSIGTSLSAVVAGTLAAQGNPVRAYTVRPRGHPFDRTVRLGPGLATAWRGDSAARYALVDEGPGLSGSSFASVAEALVGLGIATERIALLPSWNPEPERLHSLLARLTWRRHPIYLASFESVWIDSGRLAAELPPGALLDCSGGAWRRLSYTTPAAYPAVHPQHERRKYLFIQGDARATPGPPNRLLLKFAGLGHYGRDKLARAAALAALDVTPAPLAMLHGMLVSRYEPGVPLAAESIGGSLLTAAARYLATLRAVFPAPATVDAGMLLDMVRSNLAATLGEAWSDAADVLAAPALERAEPAVALDGRLLAHEWLRTAGGYRKTDAVDHHDDHFYPGAQDIAWDVAAATVELAPRPGQAAQLVRRYRALSGDERITARLPFYQLAYLAYRLAYTTAAASALGGTADGERFAREMRRYGALLHARLRAHVPRWLSA